jgi:hypothetical protein
MNEQEAEQLRAHVAWPKERGGVNLNVETQKAMTPQEIKASFPLIATRIGSVPSRPNVFWAMERELDARMEELMAATDDKEKARLQGECHGVTVCISMHSPWSIVEVTMSAMKRYQERHANG